MKLMGFVSEIAFKSNKKEIAADQEKKTFFNPSAKPCGHQKWQLGTKLRSNAVKEKSLLM